jgi:hypothetical protein
MRDTDGEWFVVRGFCFSFWRWVMTRYYKRGQVEELVMKLASGRKMGEVLKEMKIDLTQARQMLQRPMGRKVMQELRELQALQRGLAAGKKAEAACGDTCEKGAVPAGVTEEEMWALLKENAAAKTGEESSAS